MANVITRISAFEQEEFMNLAVNICINIKMEVIQYLLEENINIVMDQ